MARLVKKDEKYKIDGLAVIEFGAIVGNFSCFFRRADPTTLTTFSLKIPSVVIRGLIVVVEIHENGV